MAKKAEVLLDAIMDLSVDEVVALETCYLEHSKVSEQLAGIVRAFAPADKSGRWDFIRCYSGQAREFADKATAMGYDYELVFVPGGQKLRALIGMLDKTYGHIPHHATAVWLDDQPWSEVREMREKDNFGIPKEDQLSALLLNPNGYGDADGHHSRKGLFFTDMTLAEQITAVDKLMRERAGVRPLSIAEYLCADIVRAANKDMLLDEHVSTRFVQYGLVYITNKYGHPIGLHTPFARLSHGGRVHFSYNLGSADSHCGVRLSMKID